MPDHEPLDPNVPHPDIPKGITELVTIAEWSLKMWLAGYATGAQTAFAATGLPPEAAAEALDELNNSAEFHEYAKDSATTVMQEIARHAVANGGD